MKHTLYILFTIIILAFSGCKKDDVQIQEFKIISESVYKNTSTIVITVYYTYVSVLQSVDGYISESYDMTNAMNVHGEINKNTFVLTFNDLHANTTYYYYYEYSNGIDHLTKSEIIVSTTNDYGLPTVITNDVTDITATSAICGGKVTNDGESEITARGVCYSLNENPTIDDSHTIDSIGIGTFTSHLVDLNCDTIYYVRAYAVNKVGIQYGTQISFKTYLNAPEGSLNGLFSISDTQKVYFSQGNLQYQASINTWRFAENQWDIIGGDNSNISSNYNSWIDLFGWGTGNFPTNSSTHNGDYVTFNDWGNNAISNGGNTQNQWRTLTNDEWVYVFNTRSTASGIRYAKATVENMNGVILLPDNWNSNTYNLISTNTIGASFSCNTLSLDNWTTNLEAKGAVFLPAAGFRYGTDVDYVDSYGLYWSASSYDNGRKCDIWFDEDHLQADYWNNNTVGQSVRLVYDA